MKSSSLGWFLILQGSAFAIQGYVYSRNVRIGAWILPENKDGISRRGPLDASWVEGVDLQRLRKRTSPKAGSSSSLQRSNSAPDLTKKARKEATRAIKSQAQQPATQQAASPAAASLSTRKGTTPPASPRGTSGSGQQALKPSSPKAVSSGARQSPRSRGSQMKPSAAGQLHPLASTQNHPLASTQDHPLAASLSNTQQRPIGPAAGPGGPKSGPLAGANQKESASLKRTGTGVGAGSNKMVVGGKSKLPTPTTMTPMTDQNLRGVWNKESKKPSLTPLTDQVLPGQKPRLIPQEMTSPFANAAPGAVGGSAARNQGTSSSRPQSAPLTGKKTSGKKGEIQLGEIQPDLNQSQKKSSPPTRELLEQRKDQAKVPNPSIDGNSVPSQPESTGTKLQQNLGLARAWVKEHKTLTALGCAGVVAGCMGVAGPPLLVYGGTTAKAVGIGLVSAAGATTTVAGAGGALVGITEWQKSVQLSEREKYVHYQDSLGRFARATSLQNLRDTVTKMTTKKSPPKGAGNGKGSGERASLLSRFRNGRNGSGSSLASMDDGMGSRTSSIDSASGMQARASLRRTDGVGNLATLAGSREQLAALGRADGGPLGEPMFGGTPYRSEMIGTPLNTEGSLSSNPNSVSPSERPGSLDARRSNSGERTGLLGSSGNKNVEMKTMKGGK